MPEMNLEQWLYVIGLGMLTIAATWFDTRTRRIPNWLNVSFLALGLVYQCAFHGWSGLGDAGLGFLVGFGLFFLMWMIGAGGGGDTKLMGAISVWLGFRQTLALIFLSTLFVIFLSILFATWQKFRSGFTRSEQQYRDAERKETEKRKRRRRLTREEKIADRQQRRIMAYALPIAITVWILMLTEVSGQLPSFLQNSGIPVGTTVAKS